VGVIVLLGSRFLSHTYTLLKKGDGGENTPISGERADPDAWIAAPTAPFTTPAMLRGAVPDPSCAAHAAKGARKFAIAPMQDSLL